MFNAILRKIQGKNRFLDKAIPYIEKEKTHKPIDAEQTLYTCLAPLDDVDSDGTYISALKWAIQSDKITNIALTGIYGSGKSSVINTFKKQCKPTARKNVKEWFQRQKYKRIYSFVSISLATFSDDDTLTQASHTKQEDICDENSVKLKEIEKSILQQLFYSVKSKELPYSRFKRINHYSNLKIISFSIFLAFVFTLCISVINPIVLNNTRDNIDALSGNLLELIKINKNKDHWTLIISYLISITLFSSFLYLISSIIKYCSSSIKLNKINISNMEIVIDKQNDTSIFNKYIDEILYFFQVCKYNVVIIEDLDRFDISNSIAIFTKLRELNNQINNSAQIKQKVTFVYAIKDDLFKEKDRTKFFDFIIPIIPTINASNSNVMIFKRLKTIPLTNNITEDFIDEISIYIDDMRILNNIINEFIFYYKKLKSEKLIALDDKILLSMLVYKNLIPSDFANLQLGKGLVHEAFRSRHSYVLHLKEKLDQEILEKDNRIKNTQLEHLQTRKELRVIFIDYIKSKKGVPNSSNVGFKINDTTFNTESFVGVDFDFASTNDKTEIFDPSYNNRIICTFGDLRKDFNMSLSFAQRQDAIDIINTERLETLRKNLRQLKQEQNDITAFSLSSILQKYGSNVLNDEIRAYPFLVFLLRNGYIDEQHQTYLSYFREGSLTVSDMNFVLNIKNRMKMEPIYKLYLPEKVIGRLNLSDFKSPEVLNYDLLDCLLNTRDNENYSTYCSSIITQITEKPDADFIDDFIKITKNESEFIRLICHQWPTIWDRLTILPEFDTAKKDDYLKKIIQYADHTDFVNINNSNNIYHYAAQDINFIRQFDSADKDSIDKAKTFIDKLKIAFEVLDISMKDHPLFGYICDHNNYYIKSDTINVILEHYLGLDLNEIKTKNYSTILKSNYKPLIEYIEYNIVDYLNNVLLNNPGNNDESEEALLKLLNIEEDDLTDELKISVIKHCTTIIEDLQSVDTILWDVIVAEIKTVATWSNVIAYYISADREINDVLAEFLNQETSFELLSKNELNESDEIEDGVIEEFLASITYSKKITDEVYEHLLQGIPNYYVIKEIISKELSQSRLELVLFNKRTEYSAKNYNSIRENHEEVLRLFWEVFGDEFLNEYLSQGTSTDPAKIQIVMDEDDILLFFSSKLNNDSKLRLIESLDENYIVDKELSTLITECILESQNSIMLPFKLLLSLIKYVRYIEDCVMLINKQLQFINTEQTFECLNLLRFPYDRIGIPGRRPRIDNNEHNLQLAYNLKDKLKEHISSIRVDEDGIIINSKNN